MALEMFSKKVMDFASKAYKKSLAGELNKMGLRYEDLLNNEKPAIKEALELADPDYIKGRMRRLKRASDMSFKAKNYLDYKPESVELNPFHKDLWVDVEKIEKRNEEYELLDLYKK